MKRTLLAGALATLVSSTPLWADDGALVDARFDKTGDGIVNGADWKKMTDAERMAYAQNSLEALGEDPLAALPSGKTRLDLYLAGLRQVYE